MPQPEAERSAPSCTEVGSCYVRLAVHSRALSSDPAHVLVAAELQAALILVVGHQQVPEHRHDVEAVAEVREDLAPSAEHVAQVGLELAVDVIGVDAVRVLKRRKHTKLTRDVAPEIRLLIIQPAAPRV